MNASSLITASLLLFSHVSLKKEFMKIFKNVTSEKIGNFIVTVITAFVSTFLMTSCELPTIF